MISTLPHFSSLSSSSVRLAVRALQPQIVQWRRQIHQHPELAFQEQLTSAFLAEKLTEMGIEHQTGIAKTGIVATIKGSRSGPVLAIRADMDALPIQEENEVSYCSQHPGIMHACGHDGHTAIALGTACYLSQRSKLFFNPQKKGQGEQSP
jgi:amidohydrolase